MPEPSAFEFEMAIEKLKIHKSPGIDQIPAQMIKAGGRTNLSQIHKLLNSVWNRQELPEEWRESVILPIWKKDDKADCSNFRSTSLLLSTYKIISNVLLSMLTRFSQEITGDHQCGFRRNKSTTDHSSNTWKEMGITWRNASANYKLQQRLWFG